MTSHCHLFHMSRCCYLCVFALDHGKTAEDSPERWLLGPHPGPPGTTASALCPSPPSPVAHDSGVFDQEVFFLLSRWRFQPLLCPGRTSTCAILCGSFHLLSPPCLLFRNSVISLLSTTAHPRVVVFRSARVQRVSSLVSLPALPRHALRAGGGRKHSKGAAPPRGQVL